MEYVALVALIMGVILYARLKNDFLKMRENELIKEDQALSQETKKIKDEIADLKKDINTPTKPMNQAQVLDFWNKKNKGDKK